MDAPSQLGIRKIHSVEFVVDFFDRSRTFYLEKMGFLETHRSTPSWEEQFKSKAVVFSSHGIRILVTAPLSTHSYTAQYLKLLCPGIRNVTFLVKDLDKTVSYLREHHGTFIHPEVKVESAHSSHRFVTIATSIGFVEFTFLEIEGDAADIPMFEKLECPDTNGASFMAIDHLTINARTLFPIWQFFEHVLDFKKFWNVAFHTPDYSSGKKGTGLSSQVMYDPGSGIKLATNEPLYPHFNESQIQRFVECNHGAGIQHIALSVKDLVGTVRRLRERGVEFLHTPGAYYDLLPQRLAEKNVHAIDENLDDLRREGILVDGENGNYLLQIFLQDASMLYHEENAGPFFYEIIQRKGHPGFGEGNFRALFEAIELQEAAL